ILIFLMITTTFSRFTALQITLPTADAEKAIERPREISVAVDAQGRYAVNNVQVAWRDVTSLAASLKQAAGPAEAGRDPVVIINADALAAHQTVINVLEAARQAGLAQVTFAAQASKDK